MKQPMFGRPRPLNWKEPEFAEPTAKSTSHGADIDAFYRNGTPPTRRGPSALAPNPYNPEISPQLILKSNDAEEEMVNLEEVEKSRQAALDRAFAKALGIPKVPVQDPNQQMQTQPGMLGMQQPGQQGMPGMVPQPPQQGQMPGMGMPPGGAQQAPVAQHGQPPQMGQQPQPPVGMQPPQMGHQAPPMGAQAPMNQGQQQMQVPGMPAPGVGPKLPGADNMHAMQKLQNPSQMQPPGGDALSQISAQAQKQAQDDALSPMERAAQKFGGDGGEPDQGKPQAPPAARHEGEGPKPGMEQKPAMGGDLETMMVKDLPPDALQILQQFMASSEESPEHEAKEGPAHEAAESPEEEKEEQGSGDGDFKPGDSLKPSKGSNSEQEDKGAPQSGRPDKPTGPNAPFTNAGTQKTDVEQTAFKSFFNLIEG